MSFKNLFVNNFYGLISPFYGKTELVTDIAKDEPIYLFGCKYDIAEDYSGIVYPKSNDKILINVNRTKITGISLNKEDDIIVSNSLDFTDPSAASITKVAEKNNEIREQENSPTNEGFETQSSLYTIQKDKDLGVDVVLQQKKADMANNQNNNIPPPKKSSRNHKISQLEQFFLHYESLFYFSYRKDFLPIEPPNPNKSNKRPQTLPAQQTSTQNAKKVWKTGVNGNLPQQAPQNATTNPQTQPTQQISTNFSNNLQSQLSAQPSYWTKLFCLTTDAGWGCMLRTGQMMLSQAIVRLHLGNHFRLLPGLCQSYQIIHARNRVSKMNNNMIKSPSGNDVPSLNSPKDVPTMPKTASSEQIPEMIDDRRDNIDNSPLSDSPSPTSTTPIESNPNAFADLFSIPVEKQTFDNMPLEYSLILKLFFDHPKNPFSIHRIAQTGVRYNRRIGEWFGPSIISFVFRNLIHSYYCECPNVGTCTDDLLKSRLRNNSPHLDFSSSIPYLKAYVGDQGTIYLDQIRILCDPNYNPRGSNTPQKSPSSKKQESEILDDEKSSNPDEWYPLFLLFPLRLGVDVINMEYAITLKKVFQSPYTTGIVGGRVNSSFFFVGYQGDELIYLDPHVIQKISDDPRTYHNHSPRKIKFEQMDPSMVVGFFVRNKTEFEDLLKLFRELEKLAFPLFNVQEKTPAYIAREVFPELDENISAQRLSSFFGSQPQSKITNVASKVENAVVVEKKEEKPIEKPQQQPQPLVEEEEETLDDDFDDLKEEGRMLNVVEEEAADLDDDNI